MGIETAITIDQEEFRNHEGVKINYSDADIPGVVFKLEGNSFLFDEIIIRQEIICFEVNGYKAFFRSHNSDMPFDIFAASFYLITRYEEYLPHEKDLYGRYAHENSLAFREGFLNIPIINIWVKEFAKRLKEKFPAFKPQSLSFNMELSYDIDIAWSYKHKGWIRNMGGFIKNPSLDRIKVSLGLLRDPFDSYEWLNDLHRRYHLNPVYFFLVPEKNSRFDKNISPHKHAMWQLAEQHAKKYMIGLHPSWQSGDNASLLKKEKQQLEAMGKQPVTSSRQHYIRFNLPNGYKKLLETGITDDYSMGYGSINGFRASVASSFYWYNLEEEEQTTLRIHPFCFMDANAYYEQKQNTEETFSELNYYISVCSEAGGTLGCIWHNNFLGTAIEFEGWRALYERFIIQARQVLSPGSV